MKRTVILVDGQNLFYTLKKLGLKETRLRWNEIFHSFLEPNDELIRTYWFRPQKILDRYYTAEAIRKRIVSKKYNEFYKQYKSSHRSQINKEILNDIEYEAVQVEKWLYNELRKFSAVENMYDQICLDNSDIEIVKKGVVKIDPFVQSYGGEKGVDMALAVKMISLSVEKKCEKIILISGDYDYAEAINYVKNGMTKVHIVKIHKGFPPKNINMSRDLSVVADKVIELYEADIRSNYLR